MGSGILLYDAHRRILTHIINEYDLHIADILGKYGIKRLGYVLFKIIYRYYYTYHIYHV